MLGFLTQTVWSSNPFLVWRCGLVTNTRLSDRRDRGLECTDRFGDPELCKTWQEQGECDVTDWMLENCQRACGLCTVDENEDEKFLRIMEDIYRYRYREFPEHGSFVGFHDYDDKLESFTLAAFQRRKVKTEEFIEKLRKLDTKLMSKKNRREHRILTSYLQAFVDGYRWRKYGPLNSMNFLQGLSRGPQWPYWHRLETSADFERYLKRLAAVPTQNRVPEMLQSWRVNEQFLHPFKDKLHRMRFSKLHRDKLFNKAMNLMPHISDAINRLKRFMKRDYLNKTRKKPGVHSLPQGLQYYEACLKWYLGYDAKAEEVFELGVQEVRRIEKEIKKVMKSVGFRGSLRKFFKHIETIQEFYNHTKEQLLERYKSTLDEEIIPQLGKMFYNVSIEPITVQAVERDGPYGSYGLGTFYVNLKEADKRSTFTIKPLTLHEAYPGHHYQDCYSQHFEIPLYRAKPLMGRLYSVPFHFPVYTAYAEGWALYAEYLGEEMGLYHGPYDLFGRYISEIFRACRLVVDSGIHAFNWNRTQAIDFLRGYSDFPESQLEAEVDRYITAPGQACAYKHSEECKFVSVLLGVISTTYSGHKLFIFKTK
ncbi:hypothetical protein ElyMa_001782000 [Elysia marginata]|uniref:ShKT domain-containing protein n=1 Tax=Elysia marginata TaxID=1093978 RepID=A0AAV4EEL8_9GAST|nr:hypothetical protein ElyMa_001782000 [Elysia marginata]